MPPDRSAEPLAAEIVRRYRHDALGYVLGCFPWGEPGTALANEQGPEPWQAELLDRLSRRLAASAGSDSSEAVRLAVASGHGIGKSALVAWIILWAMSTCPDCRGIVTANTEGQLRTKTWPELAKWHALALNRDWFTYSATALAAAQPGHERTWRVDAITWSEQNTEAIAGLHNKGRRAFALFDEASALPDPVWETIEGALTDTGTEFLWCAFGNPTRTAGRFRECFAGGRFGHRWDNRQIDSRSVGMTSKAQIAEWVKDYGEDSDFVRVRVKGVFPRASSLQFIDSERVAEAMSRPLVAGAEEPLVMGVDIGRQGDKSVIRFRRGLDARSIPPVRLAIPDLMQVASRVLAEVETYRPEAVFVDATGIGWGVYDRLNQLGCCNLVAVNFSSAADRPNAGTAAAKYANKRAEMWGFMKDWLAHGSLPEGDRELAADLTGVEHGFDANDAILLERKDSMKRRGLASPDDGDALALTFAYPVTARDEAAERRYEERVAALRRRVV